MSVANLVPRKIQPLVERCAQGFPAVAIVGPRQSGKSSLARMVFPDHRLVVLESPDVSDSARRDPRGFLGSLSMARGVILDEVQRVPELLSYLLELIDQDPVPGRWVLTGSESLALSQRLSQSLAGRVAMLELLPLMHDEVMGFPPEQRSASATLADAVRTGGYPAIYARAVEPYTWLGSYVSTYVERDVRQVIGVGNLNAFQRFLSLCAGRTGQLLNLLSLASDAGISQPTARSWISVLEATCIVKLIPAWHGNVRKRLVKSPRLHFVDTGLACYLLGIRSAEQYESHPLRGPLFESWVVAEAMKAQAACGERGRLFHWRDQHGVEADLVIDVGGHVTVLEMKSGRTFQPEWLRGVRTVMGSLPDAAHATGRVIYGGDPGDAGAGASGLSWREAGALALGAIGRGGAPFRERARS
jgi:predicted AAA+ superfamily ATPase